MVAFKDLHAEQCRSEENKIDHYTGCKNMDLRWILVVVKASCSWNLSIARLEALARGNPVT